MLKISDKRADFKDKKVFVRVDFNVPVKNGLVKDDYKIKRGLKTINYLIEKKARIILATHLGKPKNGFEEKFSIKPIAHKLSNILNQRVDYVNKVLGFEVDTCVSKLRPGGVMMIENLRFEPGEKKNDKKFSMELAKLADIYVNNAFAVCHRKHASVSGIRNYLPSYSGFLLDDEVENLSKILSPKKPFVVLMGGSKIGSKITLVKNLHKKSNQLLIGGALANNFLAARGYEVGRSLIDQESVLFAQKFKSERIILPSDVVVRSLNSKISVKRAVEVGKGDIIYDIGPETIKLFSSFINKASTIVWNGPLGFFESKHFRNGTFAIGQKIASRSRGKCFGVVGGGETVEAVNKLKIADDLDWVSTGGGAMLSYLGGEKMPGL